MREVVMQAKVEMICLVLKKFNEGPRAEGAEEEHQPEQRGAWLFIAWLI